MWGGLLLGGGDYIQQTIYYIIYAMAHSRVVEILITLFDNADVEDLKSCTNIIAKHGSSSPQCNQQL